MQTQAQRNRGNNAIDNNPSPQDDNSVLDDPQMSFTAIGLIRNQDK